MSDILLGPIRNPIFKIIKRILNKLLSPLGYYIDGINYRLSIDTQTGYYKFENNDIRSNEKKYGKINIIQNNKISIVPFSYP